MKKIDVLKWGVEHIAQNHNFYASVDDIETEGSVCIYGGCNIPTIADVEMLCDSLGIPRKYMDCGEYGIDIYIPDEWYENSSDEYEETGAEMWKRYGVAIGS